MFFNLEDRQVRQKPKYKLGQLVRTTVIKKVFSNGDSTNSTYELHTITQIFQDINPSYRVDYFPERYNENLLRSTNLTIDENNQVMKKLNLIQ